MKRDNLFSENEDIQFHLDNMINWQELYELQSKEELDAISVSSAEEYGSTWKEVLSTVGEIAGTSLAPNARTVEEQHVVLKDNGEVELGEQLKKNVSLLLEGGAGALGVHPEYGGLGAPFCVEAICGELIAQACPSTYATVVWYSPIAHIIETFGNKELKEEYIPKIGAGEMSGSMSLTEPDAGSDLGNLRSYAEKQDDGSYKVFGTKRFISNGCGEISLVLAKTKKGDEGLKKLSLFLVPQKVDEKTNFVVSKIEEKIGLHGSATCELQFDGSKAFLLGKENEGFLYMLRLMNDARISVGLQGVGLMQSACNLATEYASQRKSWGKPIARHERIAEILLDMDVDTKALRSLAYQAGYHRSLAYMIERRLEDTEMSDDERAGLEKRLGDHRKLVRKWTPLIKWWVGEKSFEVARNGLQVHGGYGFTTEYRAEWLVRESLILSLYEGTSQIQALMCIKDTMKDVIRNPTGFVEIALGAKWRGIAEGDPLKKKLFKAKQLMNSGIVALMVKLVKRNVADTLSDLKQTEILGMIKKLSKDLVKFENLSPAMLHAERICEMKCYTQMANCFVREAQVDESRTWLAERFLNRALPRMQQLVSEIEADDPVIQSRIDPDGVGTAEASA